MIVAGASAISAMIDEKLDSDWINRHIELWYANVEEEKILGFVIVVLLFIKAIGWGRKFFRRSQSF